MCDCWWRLCARELKSAAGNCRPEWYAPLTDSCFGWLRKQSTEWFTDHSETFTGPVFYKGWYHLFYQYNPSEPVWDYDLVWGHAVSKDLVHWLYLENALVPDQWYDSRGVWSGSITLNDDGVPIIVYTGKFASLNLGGRSLHNILLSTTPLASKSNIRIRYSNLQVQPSQKSRETWTLLFLLKCDPCSGIVRSNLGGWFPELSGVSCRACEHSLLSIEYFTPHLCYEYSLFLHSGDRFLFYILVFRWLYMYSRPGPIRYGLRSIWFYPQLW